MNKGEKARMEDGSWALGFAIIGAWILSKFIFVPIFGALGVQFTWWIYAILFAFLWGGLMNSFAEQRAYDNLVYGDKKGENT